MRSDVALAERFAAGDEAAFDVIYERHRPVVLAVSMGVLGTTQDAEDATQETFSALAVALRTKPPAELRPWLIRVARNASIDTTRRRRHRLLTLDGEIPEIPARQVTAGQAELAVVLDGIRELPEGQRMALLMRELGGHTYAEIAEFLETDEEAVKGLIARARVGLRTYREATELPCSSARATIAAEPDGRRYDKTVRRHLRTCASCRSYRAALRDDAKALRAALPIQAGSVATGGISTGMLTAAKGTLIGYGLTQAATTCAASACAVGAIGGMVFIAPIHKLGLPPILPAVKSAPPHAHRHVAAKNAATHTPVVPAQHAVPVTAPATPAAVTPARTVAATSSTVTHRRTAAHHHRAPGAPVHHRHRSVVAHHRPTVTRVELPKLPPVVKTPARSQAPPAPTQVQAPPVAPTAQTPAQQAPTQAPATTTTAAPATVVPGNSGYGTGNPGGNGHGYGQQIQTQGQGNANPYAQGGAGSSAGSTTGGSTTGGSTSSGTTTTSQTGSRFGNPGRSITHSHGWGHDRGGGSYTNAATAATAATSSTSTSTTSTPTTTSYAPPSTTTSTSASTSTTSSSTTATSTTTSPYGRGYGAHGSYGAHGNYGVPSTTTTTSSTTTTGEYQPSWVAGSGHNTRWER